MTGRPVTDLTRMIFGKLTVLHIIDRKDGDKTRRWVCSCECGNIVNVMGSNLTRNGNHSSSCGKCEREGRNCLDLTGMVFGYLTVVKSLGKNKKNKYTWLCNCKCGNAKVVTTEGLSNKKTKSCGCLVKEHAHRTRFKDLTGERFGILTVVSYEGKVNDGRSYWLCQCDCGEFTHGNGHNLIGGNKVSCGCLSESSIASELKKYCREKYNAIKEYSIIKSPYTGKFLFYDIYIPEYNIFIEVNGSQHYEYRPKWHDNIETFERNQIIDLYKKNFAQDNGFFIEIDLRKTKKINKAIEIVESMIADLNYKEY